MLKQVLLTILIVLIIAIFSVGAYAYFQYKEFQSNNEILSEAIELFSEGDINRATNTCERATYGLAACKVLKITAKVAQNQTITEADCREVSEAENDLPFWAGLISVGGRSLKNEYSVEIAGFTRSCLEAIEAQQNLNKSLSA